jgi:prepilin-type N-terminal cleavage/methylation domain-containing protein
MLCKKRRVRGFTLVEILCVVVILGIAAAVVVPNLGTHNDQIVTAGARVVMADLMYAQNVAIVTQSMHYVSFDTTNQKYTLTSTAPNVTPVVYDTNPTTQANYVTAFSSSPNQYLKTVALQTVSCDGKTCLAFDELGQPYSVDPASGTATLLINAATIPVKCGTFTMTVSVEPYTGALSVQ